VRNRAPVIVNDYAAFPHKKGLPDGHAKLERFISVPVIENDKVVMLAGVGNKVQNYDEADAKLVELIANEVWQFIKERRHNETLKAQKERYEILFQSLYDAVLLRPFNEDGFTTYGAANLAACNLFGYSLEEFLTKSPKDIILLNESKLSSNTFAPNPINENNYQVFEAIAISKTGKQFPVEVHASLIELEGQKNILAIMRDITKRKSSQNLLKRRLEFKSAISHISHALFSADSTKALNAAIQETLELLGQISQSSHVRIFIFNDASKTMSNTHEWCNYKTTPQKEHLQNIPQKPLEWGLNELYKNHSVYIPDTSKIPKEANGLDEILKSQGVQSLFDVAIYDGKKLSGFIGFSNMDSIAPWTREDRELLQVSAQMLSIALTREGIKQKHIKSQKRLQEAQRVARLGHYTFDLNSKLCECSSMLEEIFGIDKTYIKNVTNFISIVDPSYQELVREHLFNCIEKKVPFDYEYPILRVDTGEQVWVHGLGEFEFGDDGSAIQMFGTIQDITDNIRLREHLKENEELLVAQSRHAAMGEMISMIAHQWRQPLSVIAMEANNILADIALDEVDTNELEGMARGLLAQTQHLSQTIDDFRNFFKPGKDIEKAKIKTLISDVLGIMEKSLAHHNIHVEIVCDENLFVQTHTRELIQVLINILKNAKEAIQSNHKNGWIRLHVKADEKCIHVDICDSGGGIPDEILGQIFDPYFTTKETQVGTGLGLYISKTIIEKHLKGRIEANNIDQGACFTLHLPHVLEVTTL
jgi:PAS domain S-box-containing protein